MVDVLYIKGEKSENDDLEMKYSLRSLARYGECYNRVFITGCLPDFVDKSKVVYTPADDIGAPMTNHWWKVRKTISSTDISENFILMYDDIFFVRNTNLCGYPYYFRGELGEFETGGEHYRQTLLNAKKFLLDGRATTYDFELHIPFRYNRTFFAALDAFFEPLKYDAQSMAVRSVYGNNFADIKIGRADIKIRGKEKVEDVIGGADCFSVSDDAFKYDTLDFLRKNFPERSKYEL